MNSGTEKGGLAVKNNMHRDAGHEGRHRSFGEEGREERSFPEGRENPWWHAPAQEAAARGEDLQGQIPRLGSEDGKR